MGVCKLSEPSVVIGRYQVGDRPAVVPDEPRRHFWRLNGLAGQSGKIEQGTVASATFELLNELRRPSGYSHFPAVDVDVFESSAVSEPASSTSFAAVCAKCLSIASALMGSISQARLLREDPAFVRMESSPFSTSNCGTMKPILYARKQDPRAAVLPGK